MLLGLDQIGGDLMNPDVMSVIGILAGMTVVGLANYVYWGLIEPLRDKTPKLNVYQQPLELVPPIPHELDDLRTFTSTEDAVHQGELVALREYTAEHRSDPWFDWSVWDDFNELRPIGDVEVIESFDGIVRREIVR